jgi:arsenate reductase (glutaredoxin)
VAELGERPTIWPMADITILHNQNCSTSRQALDRASEAGVEVDVVQYLRTPPDRAMLESIVAKLDDPVADLVRKDKRFAELGLDADDYTTADAVIDLLLREPALMQRPVLVRGDRAIIGRPKDRVPAFLAG